VVRGGGRIFTPFFKRRPGPCLLELSARSFRAGLWFSAGPASGPARVDPSKPGKCALGGSDSAESAAPPARAGLAGLLRWRVRARPGQREVGAANCAPASCAARPPWILRAADSAPAPRDQGSALALRRACGPSKGGGRGRGRTGPGGCEPTRCLSGVSHRSGGRHEEWFNLRPPRKIGRVLADLVGSAPSAPSWTPRTWSASGGGGAARRARRQRGGSPGLLTPDWSAIYTARVKTQAWCC
jgi:hypothetical protein